MAAVEKIPLGAFHQRAEADGWNLVRWIQKGGEHDLSILAHLKASKERGAMAVVSTELPEEPGIGRDTLPALTDCGSTMERRGLWGEME